MGLCNYRGQLSWLTSVAANNSMTERKFEVSSATSYVECSANSGVDSTQTLANTAAQQSVVHFVVMSSHCEQATSYFRATSSTSDVVTYLHWYEFLNSSAAVWKTRRSLTSQRKEDFIGSLMVRRVV
jgi:hypothetical protein